MKKIIVLDIKTKNIQLNEGGIEKAERAFRIENLYDIKHAVLLHHINNALKANYVMGRDVDYVIQGWMKLLSLTNLQDV